MLLSSSPLRTLTGVSTMLGLLFLRVFTAWKTSTTLCLLDISHTMLLAQKTPLRPPPFLTHRQEYNQRQRVVSLTCSSVNDLHEHFLKRRGDNPPPLHSQAVYNGSPLSFLLTLPLVHLENQLQEGAFGGGYVSVSRPAQILELTDHQVAFLRLTSTHQLGYYRSNTFPNRLGSEQTADLLTLVRLLTRNSRLIMSQSIEQDIQSTCMWP